MKRLAAIYATVMGLLMLGTWIALFAFNTEQQIAEYEKAPLAFTFLLIAEITTALALIIGGTGALRNSRWGPDLNLVALGMMLYAVVYSVGVFGDAGNVPATGFFAAISLLTVAVLAGLLRPVPGRKIEPAPGLRTR